MGHEGRGADRGAHVPAPQVIGLPVNHHAVLDGCLLQAAQQSLRGGRITGCIGGDGQGGPGKCVQAQGIGQGNRDGQGVACRGQGIGRVSLFWKAGLGQHGGEGLRAALHDAIVHLEACLARRGQAEEDVGGLPRPAVVVAPPAPAAVLVLEAVEPLQSLVHHGRHLGFQALAAHAQPLKGLGHHGVGQHAAHGLLHAAVGIVQEIIQPVQQGARHRGSQLQLQARQVGRRIGGQGQGEGRRGSFGPQAAGQGGDLGQSQGQNRQRQLHGVAAGDAGPAVSGRGPQR